MCVCVCVRCVCVCVWCGVFIPVQLHSLSLVALPEVEYVDNGLLPPPTLPSPLPHQSHHSPSLTHSEDEGEDEGKQAPVSQTTHTVL